MHRTECRRTAALLLAAVLCFALFVSVSCIAGCFHHDCSGEGCLVCAALSASENVLRSASLVFAVFALVNAVCFVLRSDCAAGLANGLATLVSQKVELLN